jgi:protein Tob/BTG
MKLELLSASNFLVHLVRLSRRGVTETQLARFHDALIDVLRRRYRDHWFPEKPFKGSGFRCIRINAKFDPMIGEAGESAGLSAKFLHSIFPGELTLWVDPLEVSYRIGENGSICVLYEFQVGVTKEPWKPNLTQLNNSTNQRAAGGQHQTQHYNNNKSKLVSRSGGAENNPPTNTTTSPSCKESFRDYLLIERKSASIEQLAAFVSS